MKKNPALQDSFSFIGATSFSEEKSAGKSLYFLNATMNFFIQTLNGKNDNKAIIYYSTYDIYICS